MYYTHDSDSVFFFFLISFSFSLFSGLALAYLSYFIQKPNYSLGFSPCDLAMKAAWASLQNGSLRVSRGRKQKLRRFKGGEIDPHLLMGKAAGTSGMRGIFAAIFSGNLPYPP